MPSLTDIEGFFRAAIKHDPNGHRFVTTEVFVKLLDQASWKWSLKRRTRGLKAISQPSRIFHLTKARREALCSSNRTEGCDMGFPSSATDYTERRLNPESICGVGIYTRILIWLCRRRTGQQTGTGSGSADLVRRADAVR